MINFYIYNHENGYYTLMIVDDNLPLYAEKVKDRDLQSEIEALKRDFSDTGRRIKIYKNL